MSYTPEQLLEILSNYEKLSDNSLLKNAKGKEKKKLDPKAKVRNRGTVCVPAESAKDKKDHFPINDEDQARNALARVHQYSSVPSWYSGSLKGLQNAVSRKVHSKYPGIGKSEKKKKSSERLNILSKFAGYSVIPQPIEAVQISDSLLQKYSDEGQTFDRLIAKYGQGAPPPQQPMAQPPAQQVGAAQPQHQQKKHRGQGPNHKALAGIKSLYHNLQNVARMPAQNRMQQKDSYTRGLQAMEAEIGRLTNKQDPVYAQVQQYLNATKQSLANIFAQQPAQQPAQPMARASVIDTLIAKYGQAVNNNAQLTKIRDNIQALQKFDPNNFAPRQAPKVNNLLLHVNEILDGKTQANPDMFNAAYDQIDQQKNNSPVADTAQQLYSNITQYLKSTKPAPAEESATPAQPAGQPAPAGGNTQTVPETTIQGQIPKRHQAVKTKAGYDVKKIQETLLARDKTVNLGPTGADGDWGKMTEAAFQKWKAANNLQAVTDDEAIKRLMGGGMPTASGDRVAPNAGTHAPIPAPPPVAPKAPPQQLSEVPLHINQLVQQTGQLFQQAQKMEQTVGKKQIQNPAQIQQWFQTVQFLEKQVANAKAWGNRLPPQSANAAAGAETQLGFIKDILNRLVKQTKGMG